MASRRISGCAKIKKKCPTCGEPAATEEIRRLTELWLEEQRQKKKRKQLLPTLLGLAVVRAAMIGAFVGSFVSFGVAFTALLAAATLFYRFTVKWI